MNFGKAIKEARESAGLTVEQLAEKCNYTTEYMELIESGTAEMSNKLWGKVMKVVGNALHVPAELLTILGIEDKDVPANKKDLYNVLFPAVSNLAKSLVSDFNKEEE